jgi:DNA polymerase-1
LRVLAHLSQDPVLLNAFRTGVDLHATLAQRIFGVAPKDQDESKHRLPAKAVNFGIPMGMTNVGLCIELRKNGVDIDEDDAQRWLTETMQLYRDVPVYQQAKIAQARRFGFVTDLRGRRRYIGGIRSWDHAIRAEAERFAFSTPIQAGAQEVMHEAEAYVYSKILIPHWKKGDRVEPIVQIHDDLVMEPERKILKEFDQEMVYAMTQVPAHWLSVPIETSGDYGENWGNMRGIKHPHKRKKVPQFAEWCDVCRQEKAA